ncbi:hypothetical protein BpHYR1_028487 [Brachionus plicatilis]|uniref:Uncharacterized protein n=1 Tax=Brachionus plicatilis TaxID=10195 RepID=A0A3M7R308_BRAPC|nr:hypothetical protein BpHYR1_028487 [Brachionus plicatilis]
MNLIVYSIMINLAFTIGVTKVVTLSYICRTHLFRIGFIVNVTNCDIEPIGLFKLFQINLQHNES